MQNEIEKIVDAYERRKLMAGGRYARFNPEVIASSQERRRALVSLLKENHIHDLVDISLLEIGCGSGSNLLEFLLLGATPEHLVGNELLPERFEQASALPFNDASFDIVYQSTVLSSVLDEGFQHQIADAMWGWVRPGGGILWYDFIFNNPLNPDVRGIPLKRINALFPDGHISVRRVTLAPPVARRVVRLHPKLYSVFNALPFLRSHVLCFIQKR